jgi:hypothetical protein
MGEVQKTGGISFGMIHNENTGKTRVVGLGGRVMYTIKQIVGRGKGDKLYEGAAASNKLAQILEEGKAIPSKDLLRLRTDLAKNKENEHVAGMLHQVGEIITKRGLDDIAGTIVNSDEVIKDLHGEEALTHLKEVWSPKCRESYAKLCHYIFDPNSDEKDVEKCTKELNKVIQKDGRKDLRDGVWSSLSGVAAKKVTAEKISEVDKEKLVDRMVLAESKLSPKRKDDLAPQWKSMQEGTFTFI